MIVTAGSTNISVYFYIVQDASGTSPGEPVTGLLYSDIETGGSASYARQGAARTDLTLITLASASAAHADGGFILVDDTNMPGVYRCDYPDAAFATGVDQIFCTVKVAAAKNAIAAPILVDITDVDLRDAVRAGLTTLPDAAADAAGGLPISDAGGLDLDAMNAKVSKVPLSDGTITWNATALASIKAQADAALVAINLDHMFKVPITGSDVVDNTYAAKLVSSSATADYDDYDNTVESLPAIATSVGSLSVGSAAISTQASSYVLTTGSLAAGSVANTKTLDSIYHEHNDTAGALDLYYEFDVTSVGVATEVTVIGRINSSNDTLEGLYAWDWVGSTWDRVADFLGTNGAVDTEVNASVNTGHTGAGANAGLVRLRFFASSGLTSATLRVDQLYASYAVVSETVGYANGAIWLDTVNGTDGTERNVNGTADNPCKTLANVNTLLATVGVSRVFVISGSSVTFVSAQENQTWLGEDWSLDMGGQSLSNTSVHGADISGVCTGADPQFFGCTMQDITVPSCHFHGSGMAGIATGITFSTTAGEYVFDQCYSLVQSPNSPVVTYGAGAQKVSFRHHSGGVRFEGMIATQTATIEGQGQFVEGTCTGGEVTLRGIKTTSGITNITVNEDSTLGYEDGAVWVDTVNGEAGVAMGAGSIGRPVSVMADFRAIADDLNIRQTKNIAGSVMVLDQSYQGWNWLGILGLIDFNGQDCSGSSYLKVAVTGTCTGAVRQIVDNSGVFGPCTMPVTNFLRAVFTDGTFTCGDRGRYLFYNCMGADTAGAPSVIDVNGDGVSTTTCDFTSWHGNLKLETMTSVDIVTVDGAGQIELAASCTGGTIQISGAFKVTDNSGGGGGGAVAITYDDVRTDVGEILEDTSTTIQNQILNLKDFDFATQRVTANTDQLNGDADSAANLAKSTKGMEMGAAVAGTLSTTQMSTDLTETTDDHYKDGLLIWITGTLAKQSQTVTAYNGTTKVLTFTAATEAPLDTDEFVIV